MVVTTFEVAVRETDELSVYVAEAWLPIEVPAAVCALAPVGASITNAANTIKNMKDHAGVNPDPPTTEFCFIAFSSITAKFSSWGDRLMFFYLFVAIAVSSLSFLLSLICSFRRLCLQGSSATSDTLNRELTPGPSA